MLFLTSSLMLACADTGLDPPASSLALLGGGGLETSAEPVGMLLEPVGKLLEVVRRLLEAVGTLLEAVVLLVAALFLPVKDWIITKSVIG